MKNNISIEELFENKLEKFGEIAIGAHGKSRIMKEVVIRAFPIPGVTGLNIRNALYAIGAILDEDPRESAYTATIDTGLMKAVKAFTVVRLINDTVECAAYATEGLIRQNCAEKAIIALEKALKR